MKAILDTNVLVSGVVFGGVPARILDAWSRGEFGIVASVPILDEYARIERRLRSRYPATGFAEFLARLSKGAEIVEAPPLPAPVCEDRDDDKFLACAVAARVKRVVSGDRALLATTGYHGIQVVRPAEFLRELKAG